MIFYLSLLCLLCSTSVICDNLRNIYQWKYIDYLWDNYSNGLNNLSIKTVDYIPSNNVPYDVDKAPDGRVFVTVVRNTGVPATLTTVSNVMGDGGPLLEPYPNWSWQNTDDCSNIIGVYRVAIQCNHIFVLDCGKRGDDQLCPAKLLIFNLWNDQLVKRIDIPDEYSANENGTGLLVTPIVDLPFPACYDVANTANIYMADTEGYGMVIWDGIRSKLTRVESKYFLPEKNATNYDIMGQSFTLNDGLLGMAITTARKPRHRYMYFRPLSSFQMFYTSVTDLFYNKNNPSRIRYYQEPNEIRSQSAAQAFSSNNILFYSSSADQSLICWNIRTYFNDDNNVEFAVDTEALQFASGLKIVDKYRRSESLLVMTNRYQQVINNALNTSDVNFRVMYGRVRNLVRGTNCE